MIQSVSLENFRGIQHGQLDGLRALTILVGPNGCGKSSILEALAIGATPLEANPADVNARHRAAGPGPDSQVISGNGLQPLRNAIAGVAKWRNRGVASHRNGAAESATAERWLLWKGAAEVTAQIGIKARGGASRTVVLTDGGQQLRAQIPFDRTPDFPALPAIRSVRLLDGAGVSDGRHLHTLYTVAANSGVLPAAKEIVRECLPQISDFQILTDDQEKP